MARPAARTSTLDGSVIAPPPAAETAPETPAKPKKTAVAAKEPLTANEAAEIAAEATKTLPKPAPATSGGPRIGIYFPTAEAFDDAKSAYIADWELLLDSPDTFVGWIAKAVHLHADRSTTLRE